MFGMSKPRAGTKKKPDAKPASQPDAMVVVSIPLTPAQRDQLKKLGGAAWVRTAIDKAKTSAS